MSQQRMDKKEASMILLGLLFLIVGIVWMVSVAINNFQGSMLFLVPLFIGFILIKFSKKTK